MDEGRRGRKPGLEDVARAAGVGIATVDRVLNERGNVSPETARRVIEAARRLGLKRALPRPYARLLRLEALLARPDPPLLARLGQGFAKVAATLSRSALIERTALRAAEPEAVAERIRASRADGLMLYAEEHPAIVAAIAEARRPVVCLVTDMPGSRRIAYVGIDNRRAGRTAGFLVARLARRPGVALVVTNRLAFRAHAERVEGFRAGLLQEAPELAVAAVLECHDDDDRAGHLVSAALRQHPNVVAAYNSGGATAAVGAAIRKRCGPGDVAYIGHELDATTTALLQDGTLTLTIDQNLELQAWRAVEALLHRFGQIDSFPGTASVPFTLHTRENP